MSNGHREYSHRRPVVHQTAYLIATYARNDQATYAHDRFYAQAARIPVDQPSAQDRFLAAVARWHKDNPS
jgi:hypothetical protein